jgi:hypothetical protein
LANIVFNYIEWYFGISPDNGNGSLEVASELVLMVLAFMLILRLNRSSGDQGRGASRRHQRPND